MLVIVQAMTVTMPSTVGIQENLYRFKVWRPPALAHRGPPPVLILMSKPSVSLTEKDCRDYLFLSGEQIMEYFV